MSSDEERIATLETTVKHLSDTVDRLDRTVSELRDLLISAKAVRWTLTALIAIVSFFGGGAAVLKFLPTWLRK